MTASKKLEQQLDKILSVKNQYHNIGYMNFTNSESIHSCEISSSHGGEYEVQNCLLGYTSV
jgi:hypothetical protein